jgi:hypothetical protein
MSVPIIKFGDAGNAREELATTTAIAAIQLLVFASIDGAGPNRFVFIAFTPRLSDAAIPEATSTRVGPCTSVTGAA